MDIKELFRGIVVIIDDEIDKKDSAIDVIKENLLKDHLPVVCYKEIPDTEVVKSLSNAAFIILDWDFWGGAADERLAVAASALKEEIQHEWINFIREVLDNLFVPIFIFSGQNIDAVKRDLTDEHLYLDGKSNRIFIKSKSEIMTDKELFQNIENWTEEMPSVYALKELEHQIRETKNKMFVTWYGYSPQWTAIIWDLIKRDLNKEGCETAPDCQQEFGEFLTRNLTNRMPRFEFEEKIFGNSEETNSKEIKEILEYERYINYKDGQPNQAYTGDLFKYKKGKYLLNVRAQCDLSRKNDDVQLYLLEGKEIKIQEIFAEDMQITKNSEFKLLGDTYQLKDLIKWGDLIQEGDAEAKTAKTQLEQLNSKLSQYKDKNFYRKGTILEKANEAFIACVDDGKIIKFKLDIVIKSFEDIKADRIGRILPPYITRIQQKCANRMIHVGEFPLPKEVLK